MRAFITAAVILAIYGIAHAQNALPKANLDHFIPGTTQATLAVSTISSRVALPSGAADGGAVLIWNTGTVAARIAFGDAGVVAPGWIGPIAPNCFVALAEGTATYLAAITQTGTTTLELFGGHGLPAKGCVTPAP